MPALDLTTAIIGALLVGLWLSFIAYFATDPWWRPPRFAAGPSPDTGPGDMGAGTRVAPGCVSVRDVGDRGVPPGRRGAPAHPSRSQKRSRCR
jgi:hypothetical protein